MFVGVASKAAVVLGLHVSGHYKYLSPEERDMRSVSHLRSHNFGFPDWLICS